MDASKQIPSNNSLIEEFIQALSEEIETTKKRKGRSKISLKDGRLISEENDLCLYSFEIDSSSTPQEDIPVEIEVKGKTYDAQIIGVEGNRLTIAMGTNLGKKIEEALIIINPWYLLERLKERYKEFLQGNITLNTGLAGKLFGLAPVKSGVHSKLKLPSSNLYLNEDQINAIRAACGSDVHFIWGPPGTGKTKTIGALVVSLLNQNFRVLVLSHTNIATDHAIASVIGLLKNSKEYREGKILRYGNVHPSSNLPEEVVPRKIIESRYREDKNRLAELEAKYEETKSRLEKLEKTKACFNEYQKRTQKLHQLEKELEEHKEKLQYLDLRKQELLAQLKRTQEKLNQLHLAGQLKKLLLSSRLKQIRREKNQIEEELQETDSKRTGVTSKIEELKRAIEPVNTEVTSYADQLGKFLKEQNVNLANLSSRIEELEQDAQKIKNEIKRIQTRLKKSEEKLLAELVGKARVVATTLTIAALNRLFTEKRFDAVVVDEASMAPLPSLYFVAGLAKKKAVVIGDFRQLPPIVTASSKMAQKWLGRDIFDQAGIQKTIDKNQEEPRLTMLRYQYRMHPDISSLSNAIFYRGQLRDALSEEMLQEISKVLNRSPFAKTPLALCDLSSINPRINRPAGIGGRYNLYSAVIAAELAKKMARAGIKRIGVISPYYFQFRIIKRIIEENKKISSAIKVATVHGFQGMEEDVIIFDVAEGPLQHNLPSPLIDGVELTSQAAKLINVAVTRPKAQLIIIANVDYLTSRLDPKSVIIQVLEKVRSKAQIINPEEIIKGYRCTNPECWLYPSEPQRALLESTASDESNFYSAFLSDLLTSKEEITIVSPLLTADYVGPLLDLFRSKAAEGVKIKIFTKKLSERNDVLIKELKEAGVRVVEREQLQQKFAFIDRKIIWEGNLNILSGVSHDEIFMYRFPYHKACEEIIAIHRFDSEYEISSGIPTGQKCERCGATMILIKDLEKFFIVCENYPLSCQNRREMKLQERIRTVITCPGKNNKPCGKPMTSIYTRFGVYLQCSDPKCRVRYKIGS